MLPTFQPRKPPRRRKKREAAASALGPNVTVLEVVRGSDVAVLIWRFSSEVTSVGAVCPQLQADDGEGWQSPASVEQTASNELTAVYEGETFDDSSPWQVIAEPVGVTFADGSLIVPGSGAVIVA